MEFTQIPINENHCYFFKNTEDYLCKIGRKLLFTLAEHEIQSIPLIEGMIRAWHSPNRTLVTKYEIYMRIGSTYRYVPNVGKVYSGKYVLVLEILRNKYEDKFYNHIKQEQPKPRKYCPPKYHVLETTSDSTIGYVDRYDTTSTSYP